MKKTSIQAIREKIKKSPQAPLIMTLLVVGIFALLGWGLMQITGAATFSAALEAEAGVKEGNAALQNPSDGASGNQSVRFGATSTSTETPQFTATVLVNGLNQPWDIAFLPTGQFIFSQKAGSLSVYNNGTVSKVADIANVKNLGEGGLMGIAVDPQFASNRYVYACYFSQSVSDVRVSRWQLNTALNGLTNQKDIITGIRAWPEGRHAGCRMAFGPDGNLWIGTGDAVYAGAPQDLQGLAGKILRVDREGNGVAGNLGGGANARIFNYGHRNVQGIAFFASPKNGVLGLSDEHGTDVDDEVNELRTGNFGWSSLQDGTDTGPMTDKGRFPNAISSIWSSGSPTQAPSGMTIVNGAQWKGWNGALAMGMLKAKHVKIFRLDGQNKITKEEKVLQDTYGRIRTVQQGPDGNIYLTTDNRTDDKVVRLTPQ
jgi:glucose/arabinose dehydrogenase